ncbi:MAG: hypothetical protein ACP5KB_06640 [Thermoprotei archaeon]
MISSEVVIALIVGVLTGVLLSKTLGNRGRTELLTNVVSKSTLFLTYVLVFVTGLRISQILPEALIRGQQTVLVIVTLSAMPAVLSLAVSYLMLRS